jgi:hypothetical protein
VSEYASNTLVVAERQGQTAARNMLDQREIFGLPSRSSGPSSMT